MNVQVSNKINPIKPTGLEPAPKTSDNDPNVNNQLKKPLIPVNRTSENDLMNAQKSKPESKVAAPVVTKPVEKAKQPAPAVAKGKAPASKSLIQLSSQIDRNEYPSPDIRGPVPENAHPDSTFSSHLHNDWTHAQMIQLDENQKQ